MKTYRLTHKGDEWASIIAGIDDSVDIFSNLDDYNCVIALIEDYFSTRLGLLLSFDNFDPDIDLVEHVVPEIFITRDKIYVSPNRCA